MVVLDVVEFHFKLPDFGAVCVHFLTRTEPIFIELIDNQRGIPVYHEAFDAELDSYTEAMETCFVFRGVVRDREMYAKNISEFILHRCDEQNARTGPINIKGAVEVHHPMLGASGGDGFLDFGPLSDEIGERLRLYGRPASEVNGVGAELNSPLDDTTVGLFISENVSQRELSDHSDLVVFEVMSELA